MLRAFPVPGHLKLGSPSHRRELIRFIRMLTHDQLVQNNRTQELKVDDDIYTVIRGWHYVIRDVRPGNLYGYRRSQLGDPAVRTHLERLRQSPGSQANHRARRRAGNPT